MALTGKLEADFSEFYTACANAVTALFGLNKAGDEMAASMSGAEKSTGSFVDSLAGLVTGVAGGELLAGAFEKILDSAKDVAMALPELVAHTAELGNSLYEMSLKTGASVESLSALRYVASQTGIDFDKFGTIFAKMEQNLGATGNAADKLQGKLDALGLNLTTLKNQKPDEAFLDIMTALEGIPSRADQAAIGVAIFGRGFKDMAGLTQESIRQLMGEARDLGLVMSTETAAAAHAAEVGFKSLQMQFEAVGAHIGAAFLPAIIGLSADIGTLFRGAVDAATASLTALGGSGGILGTVAAAFGTGDTAIKAQTELYEYLKTGLIAVVRYGIEPMITGFSLLMQAWDEVLIAGKAVSIAFEAVTYAIEGVLYYTNKLAQYTDPLNAAQYKADAATIATAMDELKAKMAGQATEIESLIKNEKDWGATAQATNAGIESTLNTLAATHTDVAGKIEEYATRSEKAVGGISTVAEGTGAKLTGVAKTLADLTAKIDAAMAHGTPMAVMLELWGTQAAKAALEANAMGIGISASVQKVVDAFHAAEFDKLTTKMVEGMKSFGSMLKDVPKVATDSFKPLLDEYKQLGDWQEKIYQQTTTGTDLQIHNIERGRQAAIDALNAEQRVHDATYDARLALINQYYDHEADLANKTADTIEERMARQGVFTKEMLGQQALDAAEAYNQMVASNKFTEAELEAAAKKVQEKWKQATDDISTNWAQTFSTIATGVGEIGNALSAAGTAVGGAFGKMASEAGKAFGDVKGGIDDIIKGLTSGNIIGEIAGITSGIIKLGAAAVNAAKSLLGMGSAGRDAVVSFADSFGGFDALHAKLDALGDSGEQLWIKLTQGVGKNDPAAAKAVIDEITAALNNQQAATQDTTQVTEAQAAATIETATQASNALDTVTAKLKDNAVDWQTWGDAVNGVINAVGAAVLAMPTPGAPSPTNVPGFAGGTGGQFLNFGAGTLAMLHGPERIMTPGEEGGGTTQTITVQVGQDVIARAAVSGMPRQFTLQGL